MWSCAGRSIAMLITCSSWTPAKFSSSFDTGCPEKTRSKEWHFYTATTQKTLTTKGVLELSSKPFTSPNRKEPSQASRFSSMRKRQYSIPSQPDSHFKEWAGSIQRSTMMSWWAKHIREWQPDFKKLIECLIPRAMIFPILSRSSWGRMRRTRTKWSQRCSWWATKDRLCKSTNFSMNLTLGERWRWR